MNSYIEKVLNEYSAEQEKLKQIQAKRHTEEIH